jgi:short-subunit dehydrogenase
MSFANEVAVITGASSGIGRSLALALAREGCKVGLVARRAELLQTLVSEIEAQGGTCAHAAADVGDRAALVGAIHGIAATLGPVDLLIANAGVGIPSGVDPFNVADMERLFRINFLGVLYAIDAVLPEMLKRGKGRISAVSSLAAYKGLPGQQAYCASKAAINSFLDGLRVQLRPRDISVTTICPGFVATPMTENHPFKMPWLVQPDEAARRILKALRRRKKVFNFPWQMALFMRLTRWAPDWLVSRVSRRYIVQSPVGLGDSTNTMGGVP